MSPRVSAAYGTGVGVVRGTQTPRKMSAMLVADSRVSTSCSLPGLARVSLVGRVQPRTCWTESLDTRETDSGWGCCYSNND